VVGLGEVEAAAFGEHQSFARRDEMDEGEHVGITFITEAAPSGPTWDSAPPRAASASRWRATTVSSPPTMTAISGSAASRMGRGENPIRHHVRRALRRSLMETPAPRTRFLTLPAA
jgi:hypothetical protein